MRNFSFRVTPTPSGNTTGLALHEMLALCAQSILAQAEATGQSPLQYRKSALKPQETAR